MHDMKDQFNMPDEVDPMPRDAIAISSATLDDIIAECRKGLEIDTHSALRVFLNRTCQRLVKISKQDTIKDVTYEKIEP